MTENPKTAWERQKAKAPIYTKWWLALPIAEKTRLRRQAIKRAEKALAKIIHRAGVENNKDPAVCAVLEVTAYRLTEMATDIECIMAYEIAHRHEVGGPVDAGSGI